MVEEDLTAQRQVRTGLLHGLRSYLDYNNDDDDDDDDDYDDDDDDYDDDRDVMIMIYELFYYTYLSEASLH